MAAIHHYRQAVGASTSFDTQMQATIRAGEIGLAVDAVLGSAGSGGVVVDDPDGTITILGKQRWEIDEDAAPAQATLTGTVAKTAGNVTLVGTGTAFLAELSTGDELKVGTEYLFVETVTDNTHVDLFKAPAASASGLTVTRAGRRRLWSGRTGAKKIARGMGRTDGGEIHAAGRSISVDLLEHQDLLHSRIVWSDGSGGSDNWNRPAETMAARMAFIVGTLLFTQLGIFDDGFVDYPTFSLDKADYRARYLDEVLNDLAQQSNQDLAKPAKRNIGVFYHEAAGHWALWFRTFEGFAYPSPVRISNVDADLATPNTYPPDATNEEPELVQDPEGMTSRVIVPRSRAFGVRQNTALEATIGPWDSNTPNSNLKSAAATNAYADAILTQESTEDETATVRILLPKAKVNDVREFQQCRVRMSHWPGWETERWARVVHREIREAQANGKPAPWLYDVGLKLTPAASPGGYAIRAIATERHQDELDLLTVPGELLLYAATWRQLLTEPEPPADGESWTEIARAAFVDDHDAPDPCMVTYYATISTIAQTVHTKANASGGSSNGTIIDSVMYAIPGLRVADLRAITSGPNAPGTDFNIGTPGDVALAFAAWGDGWDGFFVDPTGTETIAPVSGWDTDFHSSRDYDATTNFAFVAGFPNTLYAHAVNASALVARASMVNSAGSLSHWGGAVVYVPQP